MARSARCVVWHERGGGLDPDLGSTLARMQGFRVVRCDSDLQAFAQVCAASRAGERVALLLVEPSRLTGLSHALAATATYTPQVQIWRFEAGAAKTLAAYTSVPKPVATETTPPTRMKMPAGPPRLRLAGEGASPSVPAPEPANDEDAPRTPLLTDEELAMLLATDKAKRG